MRAVTACMPVAVVAALMALVAVGAEEPAKIKVLVVTGGHGPNVYQDPQPPPRHRQRHPLGRPAVAQLAA